MRRFVSYGPAFVVLLTCVVALFATPTVLRQFTFASTESRITLAQQSLEDDPILDRIDRAVAAIAQRTLPSVVHIDVDAGPRSSDSAGAGWVFDGSGHVITNAHVVRSAAKITVEMYDGRVTDNVRILGTDPYTDIAVLEVGADGPFFPAALSTVSLPAVGERAYAFGSPFGFKFSMSEGIISGLGRGEEYGPGSFGGYTNYIQTDAAVNPGNSGGPLVNVRGEVVGMNVAIATARNAGSGLEDANGGDSAGISFAIPLGTIVPIVDQLIDYGSVERGFIGIQYPNPDFQDPVRRVAIDGVDYTGILVEEVTADGPAETAGLRAGDIIVAIADTPVLGTESLKALIGSHRPGNDLRVAVARGEELVPLTIQLAALPDDVLAQRTYRPILIRLGMIIRDTADGLEVSEVFPGTPAAVAGLVPGDRLERFGGRAVNGFIEFIADVPQTGLLDGRDVEVVVSRGNEDGTLERKTLTVNLYP